MNILKFKDSPTLMTLYALASKSLIFVVVTPFLLSRLSTEEISLWYVLGIFINFQALADFGFYNTFVRFIALALSGGCNSIYDMYRIDNKDRKVSSANIPLARRIIGTMIHVYKILAIILFSVMITLSPLLTKSINSIPNPNEGWICWLVVIFFSVVNFLGRPYSNFLYAQNKVALVRLWEGNFNLLAMLTNIIVIVNFNSLFALVITNQIWIIVNVARNRFLASNANIRYQYNKFKDCKYNRVVMSVVWPQAWKAGVSTFTSQGVVSFSGLLFANFFSPSAASSYLFADKLYSAIRSFAQAPFYSKIPQLVTLRGQEKIKEWELIAQRGMFYSSFIIVIGIVFFDLFGESLFKVIKSNISFPDSKLWLLMGIAYFLHRFGAMHTQLYTTVNKVNSHISDLICGIIMVIFWLMFIEIYGVYVFPLGMLCGYIFFYIWYACYYSFSIIDSPPLIFEIKANLIPFLFLMFYLLFNII